MGAGASSSANATAIKAASQEEIAAVVQDLSAEEWQKIVDARNKKAAAEDKPVAEDKAGTAKTVPVVAPLSDEAKKKLAEKGWDKGIVFFAAPFSEASVRVGAALKLLKKEVTFVLINFDDENLAVNDGQDSLGVKSKDWKLLSGGISTTPGLCVDGVMYSESVKIVQMFAEQEKAPKEVMELIELMAENDTTVLEAAKNFGWSGLHDAMDYGMVNKEHYEAYGFGKKDGAWMKASGKAVKAFLQKLEKVLKAKPEINGYFVGNELTLADCALCNLGLTLGGVLDIDFTAKGFPKVKEHYDKLKELNPPGMEPFFSIFPDFVENVGTCNAETREEGFHIKSYM